MATTEHPTSATGTHSRALDGLRAVAVLAVILFHLGLFQPGWLGVPVFFVLSGHFITRTLLQHADAPRGQRAKDFFRNRALRLVPLYLVFCAGLTVLAACGGGGRSLPGDLPYIWTWTYNLRPLLPGYTPNGLVLYNHVWSLGLEVQVYLVWAALVLGLSRRSLVRTMPALVLAGPALRVLAWLLLTAAGTSGAGAVQGVYLLPFSYLDAFAVGACVALPEIRARLPRPAVVVAVTLGAVLVVSLVAVLTGLARTHRVPTDLGWPNMLGAGAGWIWQYSMIALAAGAITYALSTPGHAARAFGSAPLAWIGKVSYGVYLIHVPLIGLSIALLSRRGSGRAPSAGAPGPVSIVVFLVVLFGLTAISYRWLELPWLRRKRNALSPVTSVEPDHEGAAS
ncbi:acyltransferase family protein [Amycolatopsis sp. NBC_01480]|uniref:acyltransferase family protein n=1 Tax=Amycolatopsis sp. NBC_01480 TaxID=2903562 RepID=UPI002E27B422|nr:acyltransferase [Amycolatopsis sp. NBC_01480]